jgi:chromosome segregation ATPase
MDFANQNDKRTRLRVLENLTLPENNKANEAETILQTQLTRTFAEKRQADFENLHNRPRTKTEAAKQCQSKLSQTETQAKNLEADFSDWTKPARNFADKKKTCWIKNENLKTCKLKNRLKHRFEKCHR